MQIGKVHSWKKVVAQEFLLTLPTIALAFYFMYNVNANYEFLQNDWKYEGSFFAAGIFSSLIFYGYRFRFITTAVVLFTLYYIFYKLLGNVTYGEFDAFFVSVKFMMY